MKKSSHIALKYSLLLTAILIGYFLILSLMGLHLYVWFSLLNAVFTGLIIFYAIKKYKDLKTRFKYEKGFMVGLFTGGIATILFTFFFALYASYIDPDFTTELIEKWAMVSSFDMGMGQVIFTVGIMGAVSTFILTLASMQYLKESWNPHHTQVKKKETSNSNIYKPERKSS